MQLELSSDFKYLLFLGSGRTGSTLVGQLLNCHPNVMITNESRILRMAVEKRDDMMNYIPHLMEVAYRTLAYGTQQYDPPANRFKGTSKSDHQRIIYNKNKHAEKWQRDWFNVSTICDIEKGIIEYVGDKKQGGNTQLLMEDESAVLMALGNVNFIPITVTRDPHHVLKSYIKLNGDVSKSADLILSRMPAAHDFTREHGGIITRYENLLANPRQWCANMCVKLGLSSPNSWVEIVETAVNSGKTVSPLSDDELHFFKSCAGYDDLVKKISDYDF